MYTKGMIYPEGHDIAGCADRMRAGYTAKWAVQLAEMIFRHLWYYSKPYLIMHGYLLFHATDQLRMNVYFPDAGQRKPVPTAFRFRKAGISKFSAGKAFIPDGPAPIHHPWLTGTFQGRPCP